MVTWYLSTFNIAYATKLSYGTTSRILNGKIVMATLVKNDTLIFLRIVFCQLKIVLTVNLLGYQKKIS